VQTDMEFRPIAPSLKELWGFLFFSLLLVVGVIRMATHPAAFSPLLLAGLLTFVVLGGWLVFRQRFPGSPTLRVTRERLTYTRFGRSRTLLWTEVAKIRTDDIRRQTRIIPTTGERPIVMHPEMISANGHRFINLMETWWPPSPDEE
ncbi:MAG: hypothetical protein REJ23_15955, partial [Brevundimonas sp.]|nr:hypothetical protein [Brevundimonas sp.]